MNTPSYSDFARSCVDELNILQDHFRKAFNINDYQNWFYNQATSLLTFSTEASEVNFTYLEVGTFSTKTKTWKWSWDNEHTLAKVKENITIVKEYGEQAGYTKLTEGYFESDESEAWEFTAITAKLLNGIGAYRPVSDHLYIFIIVQEYVDPIEANVIRSRYVKCGQHEYNRRAFVCQHLNTKTKVGFEEAFETYQYMALDDDDDLQAWCAACEQIRLKEGEWNDAAMEFAQIKVVCEDCYFEMKKFNLDQS